MSYLFDGDNFLVDQCPLSEWDDISLLTNALSQSGIIIIFVDQCPIAQSGEISLITSVLSLRVG